jgi:uncharacterized protein YjbI with pentapeptide repeats
LGAAALFSPKELPQFALHLSNADLSGSDLSHLDLTRAFLWNAKLRDANLSGVSLNSAYLEFADLSGALLHGAKLEGAQLQGANLSDADFTETGLSGTNLCATNASRAVFDGATLDKTTTWDYADLTDASFADLQGTQRTPPARVYIPQYKKQCFKEQAGAVEESASSGCGPDYAYIPASSRYSCSQVARLHK